MSKKTNSQQSRSGLLTFAIILVILVNLILAIGIQSLKGSLAPDANFGLIILAWAFAWASVVAGIAMWYWKKWGIALYVVSTIAIAILTFLIFSLAGVISWGIIMGGVLPMIIVLYILKPYMQRFS